MPPPTPGGRALAHRLAAGAFIVLAIVLPALLAFTNITAPPTDDEKQRIAAVILPASERLDTPLRFFYSLTMPEDAAEQWGANPERVVVQARRAGLLALLVVSGLLYFLVVLVRGRTAAVLSCLSLCLVPAVCSNPNRRPPCLDCSVSCWCTSTPTRCAAVPAHGVATRGSSSAGSTSAGSWCA
jgi:hypothetical protein